MKKLGVRFLLLLMVLMAALTGCNSEKTGSKSDVLKICFIVHGNLGDKSFIDSAQHGMDMIKEKYGDKVKVKTVELGMDQTKWGPGLQDASDQDWDIIVVGTWAMQEYLEQVAPDHPEKKYIIFDGQPDFEKYNLKNVYAITFKQNEAGFMAGALAAKVTTSTMPLVNPEKKIGFLGGIDNPVVNDFLVGYIEGAQYIDKDMKVAISYIGSFVDSAKGKEMALAQYNQGVDIGFNVAGQAGLGQIDAAKDANKYCIGVDSDQALLFKDSAPDKADLIVSSALKRVDTSLIRAIDMHMDGKLSYGKLEVLGFNEDCIGLAENDIYKNLVSEEVRNELKEIEKKIISGEIKVTSASGMDADQLNKLRNSVKF
ncbi:BMP family ABC transporter substrate-binding protein [Neobacillus sp. NPDC093127]|uniref:BMP family ABC transporter substrate-binding protein n=1 Tax=Neobacillus sp. NPDC093127 TaxID=3364296 RepID=UPI00380AF863